MSSVLISCKILQAVESPELLLWCLTNKRHKNNWSQTWECEMLEWKTWLSSSCNTFLTFLDFHVVHPNVSSCSAHFLQVENVLY